MNKTRVDDMLIDMIEPKIQEINKKFSNGGNLTQEDINTLLLKSQYNHINHLDDKLNEVTADVASLKGEFNVLKQEFETFKEEIKGIMEKSQKEIQQTINNTMKWYIGGTGVILVTLKMLDIFVK